MTCRTMHRLSRDLLHSSDLVWFVALVDSLLSLSQMQANAPLLDLTETARIEGEPLQCRA